MSAPPVVLRILGHTELSSQHDRTGSFVLRQPKRIALLAYLAMATAGGFRRRDQIVALFWPELDQSHARTQLRKVLHVLRSTIGDDALLSRGEEEIRVDPAIFWCDAVAFTQHIEAGRWADALDLYRGDLLEGLYPGGVGEAFQTWLEDQRTELRKQASLAAWECSSREDLAGNRREALAMARRATDLDPDDEESVRRLIAVLDRYGDRAGALQVFTKWQSRLQSEFGADPAPETRKLARKVGAPRRGESQETPADALRVITVDRAVPVVSPPTGLDVPSSAPGRSRLRWQALGVVAGALGLLTMTLGTKLLMTRPLATVAVLPFRHLDDATDPGLGVGLSEELTAELAQWSNVTLRSTTRIEQGPRSDDVRATARRLRVAFIVDGSVRGSTDRLRIGVRLIRADDGVEVWTRMYDVAGQDLLSAQESVAKAVVVELRPWLGAAQTTRATAP